MTDKKSSPSKTSSVKSAANTKPVSKDTVKTKVSRPAPTKVLRPAVAPHPKTLSNGQPRPKRRG